MERRRNLDFVGLQILRLGVVFVTMWFGVQQLLNPSMWFGYIPSFFSNIAISPKFIIYLNGLLEVILSIAVLLGFWSRIASAIIALHIFVIGLSLGYNDVMIRDIGLAIAAGSFYFFEKDEAKPWKIIFRKFKILKEKR